MHIHIYFFELSECMQKCDTYDDYDDGSSKLKSTADIRIEKK